MTTIFYAWSNAAGEIQWLNMGHPKRIRTGADEIKNGPLALFMLQNNFMLPLFFNNFLPMSIWKHDFLYSCCLTCSAMYPNILDEEKTAKSLHESSVTEILYTFKFFFLYFYYIFCCGLGLSSINMTFFSFIRNYKSLKDFLFFSGWEV